MKTTEKKKFTDEDATPLDWFLLECFSKMLFGERHELRTRNTIIKEMPVVGTTGTSKLKKV